MNFSGATRYDDISERVTHVIVGDPTCHDMKLIANKGLLNHFPILNIKWLIDSLDKKQPASEENYTVNVSVCTRIEPSSPLSKKV